MFTRLEKKIDNIILKSYYLKRDQIEKFLQNNLKFKN